MLDLGGDHMNLMPDRGETVGMAFHWAQVQPAHARQLARFGGGLYRRE
jgi:hypothetical protein